MHSSFHALAVAQAYMGLEAATRILATISLGSADARSAKPT